MPKQEIIIRADQISYTYKSDEIADIGVQALRDLSIDISKGRFTAIIGPNGSGKSTLAKMFNALMSPDSGGVWIEGLVTSDEDNRWEIRKTVGMVFQNPDNQIVGTLVEEDVAFGPENLGIEPDEIRKRVSIALEAVDMSEYARHAPHLLSGGQKQRVAIAGILAMHPKCIVLDEATAMLDPAGREEVMTLLRKLNREEGVTVIHITHHMDEAAKADEIFVVADGRVVMNGVPRELFSRVEELQSLGLEIPPIVELFHELRNAGLPVDSEVLTECEAGEVLTKLLGGSQHAHRD